MANYTAYGREGDWGATPPVPMVSPAPVASPAAAIANYTRYQMGGINAPIAVADYTPAGAYVGALSETGGPMEYSTGTGFQYRSPSVWTPTTERIWLGNAGVTANSPAAPWNQPASSPAPAAPSPPANNGPAPMSYYSPPGAASPYSAGYSPPATTPQPAPTPAAASPAAQSPAPVSLVPYNPGGSPAASPYALAAPPPAPSPAASPPAPPSPPIEQVNSTAQALPAWAQGTGGYAVNAPVLSPQLVTSPSVTGDVGSELSNLGTQLSGETPTLTPFGLASGYQPPPPPSSGGGPSGGGAGSAPQPKPPQQQLQPQRQSPITVMLNQLFGQSPVNTRLPTVPRAGYVPTVTRGGRTVYVPATAAGGGGGMDVSGPGNTPAGGVYPGGSPGTVQSLFAPSSTNIWLPLLVGGVLLYAATQ